MSDITGIRLIEIAILLIFSLLSDIRSYKIKNSIVAVFIIIGTITNALVMGLAGLKLSAYGIVIPIAALLVFYALRMLGAGDIKLFSAIGAVLGARGVLLVMMLSFLLGGLLAIALMLVRKNFIRRFRYMYVYLRNCFLTHSIIQYTDFIDKSEGSKFRFSYAISMGFIFACLAKAFY